MTYNAIIDEEWFYPEDPYQPMGYDLDSNDDTDD